MRIIIDAMGGDNAPKEIIRGALMAISEFGVEISLVGRENEIREVLKQENAGELENKIKIIHAEDTIEMCDDPTSAIRTKKDSSLVVAMNLLKNEEGEALISAGSTGAILTGATLIAKRIRGIRRGALAPLIPNGKKGCLLMDCGANVECTPEYLLQFAYMGSFYMEKLVGIKAPKVGLLNVGNEDSKGGTFQKECFALLKEASDEGRINFVGNVEAKEAFNDGADVIVTDGFSGNIMLKTMEATGKFITSSLKKSLLASFKAKMGALLIKSQLREFKKLIDPSEVGGTAMLGISKPVIKAHGSSNALAIKNAVRQAISYVEADVTGEIAKNIDYMVLKKD